MEFMIGMKTKMNREQIVNKTQAAIIQQLHQRGYATCVDTLYALGWLKKEDIIKWRNGKIDCIERACCTSSAHLNTFLKAYHQFAKNKAYPLRWTCYKQNKTKQLLHFTRNKDSFAEKQYAMHIFHRASMNKEV